MIKVLGFRVLVQPDAGAFGKKRNERGERMSEGGIALIEYSDSEVVREEARQIFGTVVGIGDLAWSDKGDGKPQVKVGDYVSYAKYGGTMIEDPTTKETFILLNDLDITAIIEK